MASILTHSSRIYWIIGIAIAGGGWLVAPGAVVLLYGEPFQAAGIALQGCLVAGGIGVTCGPAIAVLTAGDRQGKRIAINAATLAVNVVAAIAWIPTHGVSGAVASYAATQLVHLVLVWALALRHAGVALPWSALARTSLASLLAVGIGWAASLLFDSPWSSLAAGAIFAICYPPLLVGCRALQHIDYEVCAELLDRAGHRGNQLSVRLRRLSIRYGTGDE